VKWIPGADDNPPPRPSPKGEGEILALLPFVPLAAHFVARALPEAECRRQYAAFLKRQHLQET